MARSIKLNPDKALKVLSEAKKLFKKFKKRHNLLMRNLQNLTTSQ